ncbi:MAG: RagB/SusD family nutrient uptake outer membrane protein, partial [Bacteroides sp.]|nr:RagB/SusD family nutrient uptake outer membrane protein [Bacteroides sp.]
VSATGAMVTLQDIMPQLIMLDGLRSDQMDVTPNAGMYLREINNHTYTPANPLTDASELYKVIVDMNEVMLYLPKVAENDRNFDPYIEYYFRGALIGMRSWAYLNIVRLYNEAAYIPDNLASLPENLEQLILNKDDLLDTLINQITPYIHDDSDGSEKEEFRLDYFVNTKALLGEIYLEKNDYANAATYLKLACESYGNFAPLYKVDKSYKDAAWSTIFMSAESAFLENISTLPFNSREDQNNPLASWMGHDFQYLVKPTEIMVDSFKAQIPPAGDVGDFYRGLGVTFGQDSLFQGRDTLFEYYITKYAIVQADPFGTDIILSRAADLHLMLCEAYNRMGDEVSQGYALMLLNAGVNKINPKPPEFSKWRSNIGIRGRVYLTSNEVAEEIIGEERTLIIEDLIMDERSLELAYEGKRFSDLVRVAERRGDPKYLADKVAAKFEGTAEYDAVHARMMNPDNWYLKTE